MITIHIDYVDGTEVSYIEGLELGDNFTTNCLTFFSNTLTNASNVIVIDKHGRSIDRNELMSNTGFNYTDIKMCANHNIYKMLVSNSLTWKQPKSNMSERYDNMLHQTITIYNKLNPEYPLIKNGVYSRITAINTLVVIREHISILAEQGKLNDLEVNKLIILINGHLATIKDIPV